MRALTVGFGTWDTVAAVPRRRLAMIEGEAAGRMPRVDPRGLRDSVTRPGP